MRGWRRDALIAVLGFAVVFALVFLAGRAFLPGAGVDLAAAIPPVSAADMESAEEPDPEAILQSLHARRATIEGSSGAVLLATGTVEGEYILPNTEILGDFCPGCGSGVFGQTIRVERGLPMDINARFGGEHVSLRIIADHVEVGTPRTGDMTIVVNSDLLSFTAEPDQCTLELLESSHAVRPASFGDFYFIRSFVGQIQCTDLAEIRGGGSVSVMSAFALDVGE
ncbi:MAG TPA: hypothetical protein VK960_09295 [Acidimicrobiia bacterium]|nr:hypothetical protein [Acidimicrobiia bacterium]